MTASQIRTLAVMLIVAATCHAPAFAHERPATAPAARFLQGAVEDALTLIHAPQTQSGLEAAMGRAMDWNGLTLFAVGRYRADLDPAAMAAMTADLTRRLAAIARRSTGDLAAMTLAISDLRLDAQGHRHVISTATLPRFGAIEVRWELVPAAGEGYRIVDIGALGLSLRQMLRGWVAASLAERAAQSTPP